MKGCRIKCDMSGPEWAYRNMTRAHHMASDAVFEKLGLRDIGQPILLFILNDMREEGETCTQKELPRLMHLSPSTVTISIKSLERRGYVRKTSDSADMRRNIVEITDAGAEIAGKCRCAFRDIDTAMYSGFSEDEKVLLTGMFNRICENLTALAGIGNGGAEGC